MSIANYFTFFRIFISPIFLLVYMEPEWFGLTPLMLPYCLLFLLGISEVSDSIDGYIARKYDQVTDLGKILDPMADSIARISVFLTFTIEPVKLPMLLIFVFIYRDSVISTLRTICAMKGYALAARMSGKIKAVIQAIASFSVLLLMIPHALGMITTDTLHIASTAIVGVAAFYTVLSGMEYLYAYRETILRILITKREATATPH